METQDKDSTRTETDSPAGGDKDQGIALEERKEGRENAEREEGTSLELGKLNRNWYRRCLDVLDRDLRKSPADPSVDDVKDLCQKIVSGFLEAVTGQAPDSSQLQFPADRSYFIPFEDDIAETFHFAKPFYRFVGDATEAQEKRLYPNSIWSFFPWPETKDGRIVIDSDSSVNEEGRTNPFEEMISARAQFKSRETKSQGPGAGQGQGNVEIQLEKSLIVRRDREEDFLKQVYQGREDLLRGACEAAIRAIFDIYRLTPGNAAIEHILLNHVTMVRWLLRMIRESQPTETVLQQEEDYQRLFEALLRSLFLTGVKFGTKAASEAKESLIERLAADLRDEAQILELKADKAPPESAAKSDPARTPQHSVTSEDRENLKKIRAERLRAEKRQTESSKPEEFKKLLADLRTFRQYLLTVGSERRIEEDLVASLGAELSKAGDTRESFVWLIPDFDNMDAGLPENFKIKVKSKTRVRTRSTRLNHAYKTFFQCCDVACLKNVVRRDQIQAYWRTLGAANRESKVFGSFENQEVGMFVPKIHVREKKDGRQVVTPASDLPDPRSQNFFLRVKICDSLGEPVINGLFVISTDHDELQFKNKPSKLLKEDQDDLIAFGKVYFFIVRDFFRALDRAQDARDIGRLNQYLYDRRLRDLDDRMQKRVKERAFRDLGLAEKHNWSKFVYEVLNNYAYSLIQKPEEVKTETFPYDRLFILPLEAESLDYHYTLPFYLFQAIFVERKHGEIEREHYSLIKPFQSPVEELGDQEARNRFRSKSFQVSPSESYLEKLYLGAESDYDRMRGDTTTPAMETSGDGGSESPQLLPPESYVPKLIRAGCEQKQDEQATREYSPGELLSDWGRDWVECAITSFWESIGRSDGGTKLWRDFLYSLTVTYRDLKNRIREEQKLESEDHWFLFRFGLLRAILRLVDEHDTTLKAIAASYHRDLRLRFDADDRLDVIRLARVWDSDPFSSFANFLPFLREAETADIQFVQFKLGGGGKEIPDGDRFILEFFRHLTNLICNKVTTVESGNPEELTWYQPLLTRPFFADAGDDPLALHKIPRMKIGQRLPPYQKIVEGEHALSMFLGFSNFRVGRGMQRSRIRCLTVMIRDYDDTKTGASMSEEEIKGQLEIDLRDLGLYTSTFFRNVQKFGADTMAGEDIRVLSTDVTQIARNWYSTGMDQVTWKLRRCVDRLLEDRLDFKLGRLRRELMDEYFDSLVDVLIREERKPSAERDLITLESFPFDRALHIPLTGDSPQGLRLSYTRTEIVPHKEKGSAEQQDATSEEKLWNYERIRREGRSWTRDGWAKAAPRKFHLDWAKRDGAQLPDTDSLSDLLTVIARLGTSRFLDFFVRGLYEADAIQTLALAGMMYHILQASGLIGREAGADCHVGDIQPALAGTLPGLASRLRTVIGDSYRSIEQADGGALEDVFSDVYMSSDAFFPYLSLGNDSYFAAYLADTKCLPAWLELFRLAENGRPDWIYGLRDENGQSVRSKVFFVYYSMSAPESLADVPANTRYRGIFAFIVDDTRTDRKDRESESADQQDIRTLIHNSVRGLRQILDIQGLANEIRQPGIERFVLGMLHRMKNELNHPVIELRELAKQAKQAKRKRDMERIESVAQTLTGFEELFQGLKNLSDHEQGPVPLQQFSTNWLGWFFVFQLCDTALGVLHSGRLDISQKGRDEAREIQAIRARAAEEKRRDLTSVYSVDLIQRQLGRLESIVGALAGRMCSTDVDVIFSFQVFAGRPMEFVGSFLLEEALVVLVENAFQAFWSDLINTDARRRGQKPFGVIKLVGKRGARIYGEPGVGAAGEMLLEITNSSAVVADSILDVLNAEVPQPMTKHQHDSKSGKKGGSGFGHYYARRIVRGFCGGQEERRKLDIKMGYDPQAGQTRVVVNLIDSSHSDVQEVTSEEVQQQLDAVFHVRGEVNGDLAPRYCLPASIRLKSLLEVARNILTADRQQIEEEFFSWLNASVCGRIARCCDEVRSELIGALKEKVEKADEADGAGPWTELLPRIESNGVLGVRRSSYADLTAFLGRWRRQDPASFDEVVATRPLLKKILGEERLDASSFIKPRYRKRIGEIFESYLPYLKPDPTTASLDYALEVLDKREGGLPAPNRQRIEGMFLPPRQDIRLEAIEGGTHLALSYNDGSAQSEFEPGRPDTGAEEQDDFVDRFRLGSTFRSYARTFRRLDRNGDGSLGALWLDLARPAAGERGLGVTRTVHVILRSK